MKAHILLLLVVLFILLSSCATVRNEVCVNMDVWEDTDRQGNTHVVVQQLCMDTDDWNRLQK